MYVINALILKMDNNVIQINFLLTITCGMILQINGESVKMVNILPSIQDQINA